MYFSQLLSYASYGVKQKESEVRPIFQTIQSIIHFLAFILMDIILSSGHDIFFLS